ncbi:hypothetical protein GCM10007161_11090 [Ignatzschineria indica]|nr:hypothetical protein GCM10007161_11090 [Ignatzschineria indica]
MYQFDIGMISEINEADEDDKTCSDRPSQVISTLVTADNVAYKI